MAASSLIPPRVGSQPSVDVVSGGFRFVAASSLIPTRVGSQPPVNVVSGGFWFMAANVLIHGEETM